MLMDNLVNPTTAAHIVEDPTSEQRCHVCNDRSTGTHYGAISCDGCKGFFRRSVRKDHNYRCRFNGNCNVDKSHRNACRACRLKRCILAGMRIDAIQSERDVIGKRKKPQGDGDDPSSFIESLMNSEKLCLQLRESVIKSTEQLAFDKERMIYEPRPRIATLNDVGTSIHQQLVIAVEWAKSLEPFKSLSIQDQAALLKANATQLIVLGAAYRSINTESGVYLGNDTYIPIDRASLVGDINAVVVRIVQEMVVPMRDLCVNSCEYVGLKAVVFFNPYSIAGASRDSLITIKRHRQTAMKALRSLQTTEDEECRFGQLLLLLPAVQTIAQQLVEDVQLCRLFQLTNVDSLMQELILHDDSGKNDEPILEQLKAEATSPATSDQ